MNVLEFRRRLMMLKPRKWYPIIQGPITSQDMINELGDLFQTYEDAPNTFNNNTKTSAFALDKSLTSVQIGGNMQPYCIVYEEGQPPIRISIVTQTVNFTSTDTYKHVVCYGRSYAGNQILSGVGWWINTSNFPPAAQVNKGIKYWHIAYESDADVRIGYRYNYSNPIGYSDSVYYIPDWWRGTIYPQAYKKCSKIRFSKGVVLNNSYYFWGNSASDMPNLTDIYAHWGLGEVPQQPGTRFTGQWKLHIPDLGNAEDNAALVAEYRSKNWGRVSGQGIFNDVEATEPQEQLD